MKRLRKELKKWLKRQFPGMKVMFDPKRPGYKLGGVVTWKGFKQMEPIDRQSLLRNALRAEFGQKDSGRISLLITSTPAEYARYRKPKSA